MDWLVTLPLFIKVGAGIIVIAFFAIFVWGYISDLEYRKQWRNAIQEVLANNGPKTKEEFFRIYRDACANCGSINFVTSIYTQHDNDGTLLNRDTRSDCAECSSPWGHWPQGEYGAGIKTEYYDKDIPAHIYQFTEDQLMTIKSARRKLFNLK